MMLKFFQVRKDKFEDVVGKSKVRINNYNPISGSSITSSEEIVKRAKNMVSILMTRKKLTFESGLGGIKMRSP